jgi:mono/diheme cytochrome c family protein
MRKYIKFNIALLVLATIVSCSDKRERQYQYMPDMYVAVPYEADAEKGNTGFSSNLKPVNGSIARGNVPYEYSNSNAAYEKAKDETSLEKGKKMYTIYCVSCHGKKGDGNGYLSQAEKFIGIPSYKDRDITEGSIYHVIMHGKNVMGSHASQITHDERWQIVQYVGKLRNDLLK